MTSAILLAVCAIILAVRLPSFLSRQGVPKKDKVVIMLFLFALLLIAAFAFGTFGELLNLFRAFV